MANHRITEHFFRRIEDTLATIIYHENKENFGLAPPPGKTAATLCNDLSIGLSTFRRRQWASVKISQIDAAAFYSGWVLRHCPQRNVVYVTARTRSRYLLATDYVAPPLSATQLAVTNGDNETQLAQRIYIMSARGRVIALAAATLFAANYHATPVSFLGHCEPHFEDELRATYPDISVLNEDHPTYGKISMIL
jgi:hypothetical protein